MGYNILKQRGLIFILSESQRAAIRDKILSYPYEKQVEILNYIIRDSLLYNRDGALNHRVDKVLTNLLSAIAIPLKSNGYRIKCHIKGKSGAMCEWASLSGAICAAISSFLDGGAYNIDIDVDIDDNVKIKMVADCPKTSQLCRDILINTALIHSGKCFFTVSKNQWGATLVFPFVSKGLDLCPPSIKTLLTDKYPVVRIILHRLF